MRIKFNFSTMFLILGLSIGMIVFSLGVSYVDAINGKNNIGQLSEKNYKTYTISSSTRYTRELIEGLKNCINSEQLMITVNEKYNNKKIAVKGITYENDYFLKDITEAKFNDKNSKEAIVGKGLKNLVYKDSGDFIKLGDTEFKVVGYLDSNSESYNIYIPLEKFIDLYGEESILDKYSTFISSSLNSEKILNDINSVINEDEQAHEYDNSIVTNYSDNILGVLSKIILVVASINIINFTLLWIDNRKKEIAIYKTFGAQKKDIAEMLFKEIFSLSLIAIIVTIDVQIIINYILNRFSSIGLYMSISYINIYYSLIIAIVLSLIATIPSYIESIKIEPAVILKEE